MASNCALVNVFFLKKLAVKIFDQQAIFFAKVKRTFVVKNSHKKTRYTVGFLILSQFNFAISQTAPNALPTGGQVVAGNATISQTQNATSATMNINQTSQRAVVNWDSFNVGKNAQVNFNQPNSSAATLNLVRAFTQGGFADLRRVHEWNKGFIKDSTFGERYEQVANEIGRALSFMESAGVDPNEFKSVDFYASHEALIIEYEKALTRIDSRTDLPYDVSGHFLWIGERTRQMDGAHIDFASKVRNPIGVKLGPKTTVEDALALIDKLDPNREPGRLTFITRMGAGKIREILPALVEGVTKSGAQVLWVCDPMHGNTFETANGYKTRQFDDVLDEVRGFFEVHKKLGTHPGGIHIELTGDDVTECLGGGNQISEKDLESRYETACDPRLNHSQSLELAFLVAEMLRDR